MYFLIIDIIKMHIENVANLDTMIRDVNGYLILRLLGGFRSAKNRVWILI